jgi:hypothetical protein
MGHKAKSQTPALWAYAMIKKQHIPIAQPEHRDVENMKEPLATFQEDCIVMGK